MFTKFNEGYAMAEELCLTRDLDELRQQLPYHNLRQRKVKTTKEIDWQAE